MTMQNVFPDSSQRLEDATAMLLLLPLEKNAFDEMVAFTDGEAAVSLFAVSLITAILIALLDHRYPLLLVIEILALLAECHMD